MSTVYFAKFNINEEIYNVYNDELLLEKLLFKIYNGIKPNNILADQDGTYKFISIDKNPDTSVVSGRLVLFAPGVHVSYDEDNDDVIERHDPKAARYITFSFDIRREIIGFVPKRGFSRNLFLEKFKNLIEASCDIGEVELFIEINKRKFVEQLSVFKHVKEVSIKLIPPNGDKEDFAELFGTSSEKIKETNSTKFELNLKGTAKQGIDVRSDYIKKFIEFVTKGYGLMNFKGKNTSDEDTQVKSDEQAPFTKPISDQSKDVIPTVQEKTRAGISEILLQRVSDEGANHNVRENRDE
ncbi:hypothetical protein ACFQZT_16740 [Paenibacillus sp. GCM10027628]|uniref:hypothetical protein n=1 Tax=Paenibacillus sp. GCM10027628 TaxID=3273413 RepID=UPI00362D59BB